MLRRLVTAGALITMGAALSIGGIPAAKASTHIVSHALGQTAMSGWTGSTTQQNFSCTVESPFQYFEYNNPQYFPMGTPQVRTYTTTNSVEWDTMPGNWSPMTPPYNLPQTSASLICIAYTSERPPHNYSRAGSTGCATNYGDSYYWYESENTMGTITLRCYSNNPPM